MQLLQRSRGSGQTRAIIQLRKVVWEGKPPNKYTPIAGWLLSLLSMSYILIYMYLRYTYIKSTEICERRLNILNKAFLQQTKFLDLISPVVCHCAWLVSAAKKRAVWDISYVIYVPSFLGSAYHHHRLN